MKQELFERAENFVQNGQAVSDAYFLEDSRMTRVSAAIFLEGNKRVETQEIKAMKELLAENTGIFSNFRGYVRLPIHCMLANTRDPEYTLKQAIDAYNVFKDYFTFRTYLPIASVRMAMEKNPAQFRSIAQRTKEIYKMLNKAHPFLTDESDELTCSILASTDLSVEEAVERTLEAYDTLKEYHFGILSSGDALFTIAQIIAASKKDIPFCVQKVNAIYQKAKEDHHRFDSGYQLSIIVALAILEEDIDSLLADIYDVDEYLSTQKHYGGLLGFSKPTRMTHAALIVASDRAKTFEGATVAIQATISAIILETIILASVVSTMSSTSSSGSK
ncbi:MAG: DUF4003 family protein [Firmicutes bacterium]|nr:DUF4003 family protein [Bacillota bacterium]